MSKEIAESKPIGLVQPIMEDGRTVGSRWLEIPILPVTDKDIASLPLQERVAKVKQLQHDCFEPVLKEMFPNLFDTARPDSVSLALTLEDMEIKDYEMVYAQARNQSGSNASNEQRLLTAETLSNTVIDSFVKDFFLSENGIDRLYLSIDDVTTHTNFTEGDIVKLLSKAKKRLHALQSPEYAGFFGYKSGDDNLTTGKNAENLRQLVDFAFGPYQERNGVDKQIHSTAEAMLDFYWHNYDHLYSPLEVTPLVAFVHDYFFAAGLSGNPDYFVLASDWLTKRLSKNKELLWNDLSINYQFFRTEVEGLVGKLQTEQTARRPDGNLIDFIASPDQNYIQQFLAETGGKYMIGKHYDRNIGLESAFNFLEEYKRPNLYKEGAVVAAFRANTLTAGRELQERINLDMVAFDWRKVISGYAQDIYLLDALVSMLMSKDKYLGIMAPLTISSPNSLRSSKWYADLIRQAHVLPIREPAKTVSMTNLAINTMFIEASPNDQRALRNLLDKKRLMVDKIRDANNWFVATNGDSFPEASNPELARYGIQNLTFYPDRQTPGHRIQFDTSIMDSRGKPITVTLFMDRYGNSYYASRNPLILNLYLTTAMQDLVLKYLNYITSGAASKKGSRKFWTTNKA